jgi:hypothetical protein
MAENIFLRHKKNSFTYDIKEFLAFPITLEGLASAFE